MSTPEESHEMFDSVENKDRLRPMKALYRFNDDIRAMFLPLSDLGTQAKPTEIKKATTAEVIAAMLKRKSLQKRKQSTIETDKKRYGRITGDLPYLTTTKDEPLAFLSQFMCKGETGKYETGRYLLDFYDRLNGLYQFAVDYMGFPKNPMKEIARPVPTEKPLQTLSWDEAAALLKTPEEDTEQVCLGLALGCGWRPIEVRRINAIDVRNSRNNIILCHGKERTENSPILKQTLEAIKTLTPSNSPDDYSIIRSRRIRSGSSQPLGEQGYTQLVQRLFSRARLDFAVYDLRRTFATLSNAAGADYYLVERLIRHKIPGTGNRYINYPLSRLVKDLHEYSPIEVIKRKESVSGGGGSKEDGGGSKADGGVEDLSTKEVGGDGGGLNSPSKRSCPKHTTSIVISFISSGRPQMTESVQTSRLVFHSLYRYPDHGTPALRHPILTRRGGVRLDVLPSLY